MKSSPPLILFLGVLLAAVITIVLAQQPGQATQPPCCRDWIGDRTCAKLKTRMVKFNDSCYNDADFAFNQCCKTCSLLGTTSDGYAAYNYTAVAQRLLGNGTGQCFDRMSSVWCKKLLMKTDVWTTSQFSCDSSNLAFRVCRLTCGYCTLTGDAYINAMYTDVETARTTACQTRTKAAIGR